MKYILSFILLIAFEVNAQNSSIQKIIYGTSFGECSGYCISEMTIDSNKTIIKRKVWNDKTLPTKTKNIKINHNEWNSIINSVNLKNFLNLPGRIGCPDCADGGLEWIEIKTTNKIHRITFEYNSNIKGLEKILTILRKKAKKEDIKIEHKSQTIVSQEFIVVDESAEFPGGPDKMNTFIQKNITYPEKTKSENFDKKIVYVNFTIDTSGEISNVKILKGIKDCPECDEEALRIIKIMPKWKPAILNNKKVKSSYNIPLKFIRF